MRTFVPCAKLVEIDDSISRWTYATALQPAPMTESEIYLCIFDYIDRLFAIVRPRKLLYMAIGEASYILAVLPFKSYQCCKD